MFADIVATKNGLFLSIKEFENLDDVILEVKDKINNLKQLLEKGDKIGLMFHENCKPEDTIEILKTIEENGLKVFSIQFGKPAVQLKDEQKEWITMIKKEPTIFLRKNIRSGQRFEFNGNVVIFGNVGFGAELIVGGHLVVFGSIRGNVTAGRIMGEKALVASVEMNPTSLRIGRCTLKEKVKESNPCIAYVRAGRIVIENYLQIRFDLEKEAGKWS